MSDPVDAVLVRFLSRPMTEQYVRLPSDHAADMLVEAIGRFADEDNCSVAEWAARATRSAAVHRLQGEASTDGYDTLSAQRRTAPGTEFVAKCGLCQFKESWTTDKAAYSAGWWHLRDVHQLGLTGDPPARPELLGRKFEAWEVQS